jgi:hypothetical protein
MEGWRAVTTDDHKVGTVVADVDDFVIIEHGMLRKSRHAVPKAFVHDRPESEEICLSLPKDMLEESPKVENGVEFDRDEVSRYFGLAESGGPEAEGYGEYGANEPAWSVGRDADAAHMTPNDELRAEIREGEREQAPSSPGLLGDRERDYEQGER